jgi:ribosomal protein S18 acetylase RimI-like enzyme
MWRHDPGLLGPERATGADVDAINVVFAEAFTDRYQRDGMGAVRVPELNPAVWRFAIAAAAEGALLWRDEGGGVAAFNMVHAAGTEGWMGPLAVRPDCQGRGLGRAVVTAGIELLQRAGCRTIGLEAMPRTIDNIGFYSGLGFRPGHLTVTMARELRPADRALGAGGRDHPVPLALCRDLTARVAGGADYSREVAFTREHGLGDVTAVAGPGGEEAFALWHSVPLAAGRGAEEVRVLKLVATGLEGFTAVLHRVIAHGAGLGFRRLTVRCQTAFRGAYAALLALGFRVHWTDLRMALDGYDEVRPARGVVFSNWEI